MEQILHRDEMYVWDLLVCYSSVNRYDYAIEQSTVQFYENVRIYGFTNLQILCSVQYSSSPESGVLILDSCLSFNAQSICTKKGVIQKEKIFLLHFATRKSPFKR